MANPSKYPLKNLERDLKGHERMLWIVRNQLVRDHACLATDDLDSAISSLGRALEKIRGAEKGETTG